MTEDSKSWRSAEGAGHILAGLALLLLAFLTLPFSPGEPRGSSRQAALQENVGRAVKGDRRQVRPASDRTSRAVQHARGEMAGLPGSAVERRSLKTAAIGGGDVGGKPAFVPAEADGRQPDQRMALAHATGETVVRAEERKHHFDGRAPPAVIG